MPPQVFELESDNDADYLDFVYEPSVFSGRGAKPRGGKKQVAAPIVREEMQHHEAPTRGRPAKKKHMGQEEESITAILERHRGKGSRATYGAEPEEEVYVESSGRGDGSTSRRKIALKQVQEHQNLINQLNAYYASERFRPVIDQCGLQIKNLAGKSVAELKELKERVRACCANGGGSGGIVSSITLGFCGGMEAMAPKRVIDLEGYREAVAANPEFEALAEMIEIDSGFKSSMTPMQRMALCLGTTALQVGAQNKAKNRGKDATQQLLAALVAQKQALAAQQAGVIQSGNTSESTIVGTVPPVAAIPQRPNIDPAQGNPYSGTC